MFSTSTGSSPQSAPTTPDSSSNTGSDDFPSSQPEHNENHGPDLWGYSLSSGTATLNSSSTGIMLDDVGMGMMGLGFDDQTFESGQGTTPGGSSGLDHCSMPLQDLIHENLISNSPMASTTGIGVPQTMFPMAWFNRSANANPNGASQARSQSPSTPLNSPVQPMLGASSPPPPSIDTAFFTLSQPSYSEPSSQAQYPSEVSQGQALPSQQAHQQQQALPPDAFVHAPVLAPTAATNKRYPNGGGGGTGDHSRSGSTSNSQLQSPSSQSPVKVKIEKTGGGGIGIIGNAGLFSGNTASTSRCVLFFDSSMIRLVIFFFFFSLPFFLLIFGIRCEDATGSAQNPASYWL
ncbi:hypothetical protein M408DRAFT_265276 [Serendipita vermifera MAFF 305830]|uniref:Uncharacterized protein n=1 Tax=Serendipita vermifera MAFF 305830 TaxID=933852 RepID=A0A0C2X189_SERVB|nr:hypothetical protein M408DRAFT_265276 [Serendipita vermifera MAFF 305830]